MVYIITFFGIYKFQAPVIEFTISAFTWQCSYEQKMNLATILAADALTPHNMGPPAGSADISFQVLMAVIINNQLYVIRLQNKKWPNKYPTISQQFVWQ